MKRSELSATGGTKPDRVMRGLGLLMFAALLLAALPLRAQAPEANAAGGQEESEDQEDPKTEDPKTIEDILENSDRIDGLFTLYRDRKTGDLRMLLSTDQLDRSYLYFTYAENGVPAAGRFRGAFGVGGYPVDCGTPYM